MTFMTLILQWLVTLVISYALSPKPQVDPPAALEDIKVPSADEGKEIGVVFGTVWIESPNVVWYGDLHAAPIKAKGKK
jgi:hypothetical protein